MTGTEFMLFAEEFAVRHPTLRRGQAYYHALMIQMPELAADVQNTEFDPYHNDQVIPTFLGWLFGRLSAAVESV